MKLVFCGTPQFAAPTLERLVAAGHHVELVVTQPDRPRGRGLELAASPVKQTAQRLNLEITQPEQIKNNAEFRARLESIQPDAIIVVGYGRIIPDWMIALPRFGNINLHASLLPKYRGAAPIQWAIANGETVSGNTTMRIDAGLDTGDILLQQELPIEPDDNAITYAAKLAEAGAGLMVKTLTGLEAGAGAIRARPQDSAKATLAPMLKREDGLADFEWPAKKICDRLRGFQPWPGVYTVFRGRKLRFLSCSTKTGATGLALGEITLRDSHLLVGCGQGTVLAVSEVQVEGGKEMSARDFANGYRLQVGEKFGT